ncbi:hypothetical protein F5Y05DRAFT_307963 [Hypoxylon sp. FL0543]|nr:hypothetical protein F5Y05DRAFT_307963 [Hypoxylon sp. FL0543]
MIQKSANTPHPGNSKNIRTRTPDSIVWKGTKAKYLVSSVRFSWDKFQKSIFVEFLKNEGLSFKNADIQPLLRNLNLDGYDDIENVDGENVSDLIEEKVRRKLKNTADELGEDVLKRATFGPGVAVSTPTEEHVDAGPTRDTARRQSTATPFRLPPTTLKLEADSLNRETRPPCDTAGDKEKSQEPSPPYLKMPKQKAPIFSPNPESTIKKEPKDVPPYAFGSSQNASTSRPTPREKFNFVPNIPPPKFGLETPKTPSASSRGTKDASKENWVARSQRFRKAVNRLSSWSRRTEVALDEVEAAVDILEAIDGLDELTEKVRQLKLEFSEVMVGVDDVEDLAAEILPFIEIR